MIGSDWVKTALLGVERTPLPAAAAASPLTPLFTQLPSADAAAVLLSMAGVTDLFEHAGQQPGRWAAAITTAPVDTQPVCDPSLAARLTAMLDGQHPRLLAEFLQGLAHTGRRVPDDLLPLLLSKGVRIVALRPFILPVIGENGRWLAAQRPDWQYAVINPTQAAEYAALWQQAGPKERQALLQQLRRVAPDAARQLLSVTWRSEPDAVRNQFIRLLDNNLSLADEPFLERALDDRHHLVRQHAARLLSHLPDSRLCRRMAAAAATMVSWNNQDGAPQIDVRFPNPITPALLRDGVLQPPNIDPARLRRRQLLHILSATPLAHWCDLWQTTPTAVAHAITRSSWQHTLRTAFTNAARRQNDTVWAYALLHTHGVGDLNGRLVSTLSTADYVRLMKQYSHNFTQFPDLERGAPLYVMLKSWTHPWPDEAAVYYLRLFAAHIRRQDPKTMPDPTLRIAMQQFMRTCPPPLINLAQEELPAAAARHKVWQRTVTDLLDLLTFRRDMWQELEQQISGAADQPVSDPAGQPVSNSAGQPGSESA